MDIIVEFAEWAQRNGLKVGDDDDDDDDFYDNWLLFLDDEYNEQRKHPELYLA